MWFRPTTTSLLNLKQKQSYMQCSMLSLLTLTTFFVVSCMEYFKVFFVFSVKPDGVWRESMLGLMFPRYNQQFTEMN